MLNFYAITSIIAAASCYILAVWVLINNPRGSTNRSFFFNYLCLASWISWDALVASQGAGANLSLVLLVGKALHIFIIMMSATLVWWAQATVGKERDRIILPAVTAVSGILVILNLTTRLILKGVVFKTTDGNIVVAAEYGPLYNVFYSVFAFALFYAVFQFIQCYRKSESYKRNQIRYIMLAAAIGFLIPCPVYFLNAVGMNLPPIDNLSLIMVSACIAYGVVRYRAMDVTVVIKRGLIYTVSLGMVVGGYVLLVIAIQAVLHRLLGMAEVPPLILTAMAAFTIALAFEPVKQKVTEVINKAFYKGGYDYHQSLRKFSKVVAATLSLGSLARFVVNNIKETMQSEKVSLLLREEANGAYVKTGTSADPKEEVAAVRLKGDSAIISLLTSKETVVIKEGLEQFYPRQQAQQIKKECAALQAEIVLPMFFQGKLTGVVGLGKKLSGSIYSAEDIELLVTMLNQTAVAVQNARLYGEVVASRDYTEHVLKNLTSAVVTVDSLGRVTAFNQLAEIMTGRRSDEVIGKSCEELSQDKNSWLSEVLLDTLKRGKTYINYETALYRGSESSISLGVSTAPLRNYNNEMAGAIMVLTDLSSIKDLEEKVRRSDRLVYLGTMAAGMAHEIRNPLSSIKTFIQLLPRKFEDPDFRDSFSQIAAEEVEKINTLINRLLDFSRPKQLQLMPVNISQAIDEILLLMENEISEKKIQVKKDIKEGFLEIIADKEQIKQVFLNLILNSVQAMGDGGELRIEIAPRDGKVSVVMADTGSGIKPENLKRLFDPFFSTKSSGSGLGLAIVNRIIEEHRGKIEVESEVGRGTEFTIELPAARQPDKSSTTE